MKKKILSIILLGCMALSLMACGNNTANNNTESKDNTKNEATNDVTNNVADNNATNNKNGDTKLSIEALSRMSETSKDEFVYFAYEGVAYITEFIGDSECVVIPNEIDGNPVVEISNTAFRNNTKVKAVKIGDNVKKIGDYAFANCTAMEYVLFGNSVENVGEAAFVGCASMKEFKLNEGLLTVGALAICEAEVPTIIPRSVTEIGRNGFRQPVKVYKGSYAEEYIVDYANNFGAEFVYEIIE